MNNIGDCFSEFVCYICIAHVTTFLMIVVSEERCHFAVAKEEGNKTKNNRQCKREKTCFSDHRTLCVCTLLIKLLSWSFSLLFSDCCLWISIVVRFSPAIKRSQFANTIQPQPIRQTVYDLLNFDHTIQLWPISIFDCIYKWNWSCKTKNGNNNRNIITNE